MIDPFVDSHVHFWDPRLMSYPWLEGDPVLHRPYLPEDLAGTSPAARSLVVVQAECAPEQSAVELAFVEGLAGRGAPILGIVAHAALENGRAVAGTVARLAADEQVVGVRRVLQDEARGFALTPGFVAGVGLLARHGLVLDICVRHHQLPDVVELVRRCPEATFVLDHLGKPDVAAGALSPWAEDLARLAASPRVYCKLSGLASEAAPGRAGARHVGPYLEHALRTFGARRCMFGSDWPVVGTVMSYGSWFELVRAAVAGLAAADRERVMGGTALAVYRSAEVGDGSGTDR